METEVSNKVETDAEMNFFQRITGVVFSPTETFKSIVKKPEIIFPILAVGLTGLIFILITYDAYMETIKRMQEMVYTENLAKNGNGIRFG